MPVPLPLRWNGAAPRRSSLPGRHRRSVRGDQAAVRADRAADRAAAVDRDPVGRATALALGARRRPVRGTRPAKYVIMDGTRILVTRRSSIGFSSVRNASLSVDSAAGISRSLPMVRSLPHVDALAGTGLRETNRERASQYIET